mmetsp:Transcript_9994/g.29524  ORF Transcript_9994/g.29524 Transcript_9994/m.29524 type:complete len:285 (+) Transcript_9994:387-1241(+)
MFGRKFSWFTGKRCIFSSARSFSFRRRWAMACSRSSEACGNSTLSSRLNCSLRSWKSTFLSRRRSLTFATATWGATYSTWARPSSFACERFLLASFCSQTCRACLTSSFSWQAMELFQSGQSSLMQCAARPRSSTMFCHFPVRCPMGPLPVTATMNLCRSAISSSLCAFEGWMIFSSRSPARTFRRWRFRLGLSFWIFWSAMVEWFHSAGSVPRMFGRFFFSTWRLASRTSFGTSPLWKTFWARLKLILSLFADPTWNLLVRKGCDFENALPWVPPDSVCEAPG